MLFFYLYHDIPPCQRCQSPQTGYYIQSNISEFWIIKWALRHGEYVMFKPNVSDYNCFCGNCGIEWHQDVPLKLITRKKMNEIKELKGIETAQEYINKYQKDMMKLKKQEDKQQKKEKKRNRLSRRIMRKTGNFIKGLTPFKHK